MTLAQLNDLAKSAGRMTAYRSAAVWIETALGCFAEAAERMPETAFLAEHQAAHDDDDGKHRRKDRAANEEVRKFHGLIRVG